MIFNRYTDYESLSKAIAKTRYPGGGTNTAGALTTLVTTTFTPERGDRSDVPNTAIIFTDGESTVNEALLTKAIDDVRKSRANVLVVGITNAVSESTLKDISSPPHQVYCIS